MKKLILKIILLFVFILSLTSCETQVGTAIGAAFTNLFTGNSFADSASDEAYKKIKDQTINQSTSTSGNNQISFCPDPLLGVGVVSSEFAKGISAIKENLCSCKAWGTCDKLSCKCEILCPKDFKIFDRPLKPTPEDAPENSLAFNNLDSAFFAKDPNYAGYCWGHALVTQRFNRLASFSPLTPKKFDGEQYNRERLREYKYIIEKLNNNEPVEIPGFKNLKEFSQDPEVKVLLQESVKENWAQNAMSSQGLSMVTGSDPESADYYNNLFDDLEFRLKNNQSPAIVFNQEGNAKRSHTTIVSGYGAMPDGRRYICIRDNNLAPEKSLNCKNKMLLNKTGKVTYTGWLNFTLGKIKLSYSENSNTLEQMNNLKSKCQADKNCLNN